MEIMKYIKYIERSYLFVGWLVFKFIWSDDEAVVPVFPESLYVSEHVLCPRKLHSFYVVANLVILPVFTYENLFC